MASSAKRNALRASPAFLAGCALIAFGLSAPRPAAAEECAFISIWEDNEVAIVNLEAGAVVATIPVTKPRDAILSPDRERFYTPTEGGIAIIETVSRRVDRIRIGRPAEMTLSGDGRRLFASVLDTVYELDAIDGTVIAAHASDRSFGKRGLAASFDGTLVYGVDGVRGVKILDTGASTIRWLTDTGSYSDVFVDAERHLLVVAGLAGAFSIDLDTRELRLWSTRPGSLRPGFGSTLGYLVDEGRSQVRALDSRLVSVPHQSPGDFAVSESGLGVAATFFGIGILDLDDGAFNNTFKGYVRLGGTSGIHRRIVAGNSPACAGTGCPGDCDGDGEVTVDEVTLSVSVALGERTVDACRAADTRADRKVDVVEVIDTVEAVLQGCTTQDRKQVRFSAPSPVELRPLPFGTPVPDLNGDGVADSVVIDRGRNELQVLLSADDGSHQQTDQVWPLTPPFGDHFVVAGDFNADGFIDLVTLSTYGGDLVTLQGAGDGTFTETFRLAISLFLDRLAVADVNADGALDILSPRWVFLGNGDGSFAGVRQIPFSPSAPPAFGDTDIIDLNGDGFPDLLTRPRDSRSEQRSIVYIGSPGPAYTLGAARLPPLGEVFPVDVDGDGAIDLVEWLGTSILIHRGDGNDGFYLPQTIHIPGAFDEVAVQDVDLNGRPDLVFRRQGGGGRSVMFNEE